MMMRAAMQPRGGGEATPVTAVSGDPRHEKLRAVLETRKGRLVRKASELATRCAVPVALSCPPIGVGCEPLLWPSKEEAREINKQYKALPEKDRRKHSVGDAAYLAKQCPGGESATAAPAQGEAIAAALDAMPDEALRELLRSIDCSLAAASHTIQKAADEAEQKLSLQRADTLMLVNSSQDAAPVDMGDNPVTAVKLERADTLMVVNSSQDAAPVDMGDNPVTAVKLERADTPMVVDSSQDAVPPSAAPTDMGDNPAETGEDVVTGDQVQGGTQPQDDNAASANVVMPPTAAVLECAQEPCAAPPAASGNGVPYDGKYINLGGYMIERDRFDAIWREHAIPPQSIQPQSLPHNDGQPLQLWSFDDGETSSRKQLRGEDQSSVDTCVDGILDRLKGLRSMLSLR